MIKIQSVREDIVPLTDFRNQLSAMVQRIQERKNPLILTHSGRAAAILMSVDTYEELLAELEMARQAIVGLTQLTQGEHPKYDGIKRRGR